MKLCLIYNFAQHYRAGIFKKIDEEFDCDFYFGDSYLNVQKIDYNIFQGPVKEVHNVRWKNFYFQKDVLPLLNKPYDAYLIFSQIWCISTWLFLQKAKMKKKPVYVWSHGWYGKESSFVKFLKKKMYSLPKGIFLYGNHARELMIKEGFDENKLFTIHNSLEYEQQKDVRSTLAQSTVYADHFQNSNPTLLFIGRLTTVKQLDLIIKAMAICRKRGKEYNAVLIGDGAIKQDLQALCKEMNLDGNVWFYGPCYDDTVLGDLIYNADLCVAPGNIGLTAMHTMVYGTPAVTHNDFKWQMPEFEAIRQGETGAFFERNDVESLAHTIDEWFDKHGNEREAVRQACMKEIDDNWTPAYQIGVLKNHLIP